MGAEKAFAPRSKNGKIFFGQILCEIRAFVYLKIFIFRYFHRFPIIVCFFAAIAW